MAASGPQIQEYTVELLTSTVHVSGKVSLLGDFILYLNDTQRLTIVVKDAQVTPLQTDWRVGGVSRPQAVVPKSKVHILMVADLNPDALQLMPHPQQLIVYTDTFVVNATLYIGADTNVPDIFYVSPGPFFPATQAQVYSVKPLNVEIKRAAPVIFIHREHIGVFYQK